jgi:hypothetical protein
MNGDTQSPATAVSSCFCHNCGELNDTLPDKGALPGRRTAHPAKEWDLRRPVIFYKANVVKTGDKKESGTLREWPS